MMCLQDIVVYATLSEHATTPPVLPYQTVLGSSIDALQYMRHLVEPSVQV